MDSTVKAAWKGKYLAFEQAPVANRFVSRRFEFPSFSDVFFVSVDGFVVDKSPKGRSFLLVPGCGLKKTGQAMNVHFFLEGNIEIQ